MPIQYPFLITTISCGRIYRIALKIVLIYSFNISPNRRLNTVAQFIAFNHVKRLAEGYAVY